MPIWPCSGIINAHFEDFFHNAERVMQIVYAWRIIPRNEIVPN